MNKSIEDIKHKSYGYYREALTVGEIIDFLQEYNLLSNWCVDIYKGE